ncbi:hypothetical protein HYV82_01530 [Candidatus Woesearchaeota archaeon]|nr:hypothetical protein [Candidatus Woesearchaeota archaeon]
MKWHGRLFLNLEHFWRNLRRFAFNNRSVFELGFILIYSLEQLGLVWFGARAANTQELLFTISIFILMFFTTFAVHKIVMESRIKLLEEELTGIVNDKLKLELKFRHLYDKHAELKSSYNDYVVQVVSKSLNINKKIGGKKGRQHDN